LRPGIIQMVQGQHEISNASLFSQDNGLSIRIF